VELFYLHPRWLTHPPCIAPTAARPRRRAIFADHGFHSSREIDVSSTWTEVGLLNLLDLLKKS
jgi:hypothetical protein